MSVAVGDSIRQMHENYKRFNSSGSKRSFLEESTGPSIPSQFQTIIIDNSDKQGFSSRAKRFNDYQYMTPNPGPGAYSSVDKSAICRTASQSKKGSGGFASRTKRSKSFTAGLPGLDSPAPGSYIGPSHFAGSRRDFNQSGHSSSLHPPVTLAVDKSANSIAPAPNMYQIPRSRTEVGGAQAAFKSTSRRTDLKIGASCAPPPNKYDVNDSYTQKNVPVPMSSFKTKVSREIIPKSDEGPGPGYYDSHKKFDVSEVKRLQMPKKHYLCISAPAMPLPKPGPAPGPGAYDLPTDFPSAEDQHYIQSSMFLSTTDRNFIKTRVVGPGPATYKPMPPAKQSFYYNSNGNWAF